MPSRSSVHEQLTDILVRLTACPADAVVPAAELKSLGVDSLTIVELGEELGRRFGIYLSDSTIDSLKTVQGAIDAVVGHDGATPPAARPASSAVASGPPRASRAPRAPRPARSPQDEADHRGRVRNFAITFIFLGLMIGGVLGFGGAALVSATGISKVDLPPIAPSAAPTAVVEPDDDESEPEPPASPDEAKPTINTSSEQVSPGERFYLSGAFPDSPEGQDIQVEVRDPGASWDDFPIQTQTRDGGIFRTELYTSRTGAREFRVTNKATGVSTPKVKVEIG